MFVTPKAVTSRLDRCLKTLSESMASVGGDLLDSTGQ